MWTNFYPLGKIMYATNPGKDGTMDNALIDGFRDHAVWWMLLLFVGVLYWAFRGRFRARRDGQAGRDDHPRT